MAKKIMTVEFLTRGLGLAAPSCHATLAADFRAELADKKSPLDSIRAEKLEQSRQKLGAIAEVAGEPVPTRKRAFT
jgi:hypothetical protein